MNLIRNASILLAASSLFGCASSEWNTLTPPVQKALGRYVEKLPNNRVTLGGEGFVITDDLVELSPSYDEVKSEEYSNYKANAEASFKGIVAKAGIDYSSSEVSTSSGWTVAQIKNFTRGVPLEKEFIYKCIMFNEYNFEAKKKTSGEVKLDAGNLASTFGVDVAKIELSSSPASPDLMKIKVKNPNLCFSYVSAKLNRPLFPGKDKVQTITKKTETGEYKNSFNLSLNETSEPRSPDLGSSALHSKPRYRLFLSGSPDNPTLSVWKEDREFPDNPPIYYTLREKTPGRWFGQYGIENYQYGDMKYALVRLELDAKRLPDGTVEVKSADLYSPTYKLSLR